MTTSRLNEVEAPPHDGTPGSHARVHFAGVDLVVHDPALDVVPAMRQLDLLALDVDEAWLRVRATRQS